MLSVTNLVLSCAVILSICSYADAQIYQWTDENGKVHYSDEAPQHIETSQTTLRPLNVSDGTKANAASWLNDTYQEEEKAKKIQKELQQKTLAQKCKKAQNLYIDLKWGKSPTARHTVLIDENGKELSRRAQNEKAEKFRKGANKQGCNIVKKEW
jgi:hypothetical protein